nr:inhibitor of growth protein 5 isoform X1 [Globicephala melas]
MATAMYLEHYLDSIENLPCELQRNFQLMRELDQRTEDKKAEIDILAAEYISTVKTLSPGQRVEHLQRIQSAYSKCREYSDDKVQLAMQTYEMVDKHIRRLDADLARFEADLKDKMEGSDFESSGGRGLKKGRGQKEKRGSRGRGRRTSEEDTPKKKKHKGGCAAALPALPVPGVLQLFLLCPCRVSWSSRQLEGAVLQSWRPRLQSSWVCTRRSDSRTHSLSHCVPCLLRDTVMFGAVQAKPLPSS